MKDDYDIIKNGIADTLVLSRFCGRGVNGSHRCPIFIFGLEKCVTDCDDGHRS